MPKATKKRAGTKAPKPEKALEELELSELEYKLDEIKSLINKKKSYKYPLKPLHTLYSKINTLHDFEVEVLVPIRGNIYLIDEDNTDIDVFSDDLMVFDYACGSLRDHPKIKKMSSDITNNSKFLRKEIKKMSKKINIDEQAIWRMLEDGANDE